MQKCSAGFSFKHEFRVGQALLSKFYPDKRNQRSLGQDFQLLDGAVVEKQMS